VFSLLTGTALAALADRLIVERYAAGEDVVQRGQAGDKMFIINRGQAEVLLTDGGTIRRLNTLNDGDYFGEMALLAGEPRTATVRTTMPTEFYSLSQEEFKALMEQEPGVRDAVMATVAERRAALAAATALTRGFPAVPAPS
jgi:ATP-binding cassette subfamily B protein